MLRSTDRRAPYALLLTCLGLLFWPASAGAEHDQDALIAYTLTPERAKLFLDVGEKVIFIDLRPATEFRKKRLPGARSVPKSDLEKQFGKIPRAGRVIIYCDCPAKEIDAAYAFLEAKGYRNVSVMEEGFAGWVKRKYPVESGLIN
ncbi:MAG TPA: rhodanese-like domain-containing protein [Candidatus Binatia bacterium]